MQVSVGRQRHSSPAEKIHAVRSGRSPVGAPGRQRILSRRQVRVQAGGAKDTFAAATPVETHLSETGALEAGLPETGLPGARVPETSAAVQQLGDHGAQAVRLRGTRAGSRRRRQPR